MCGFPGFDFALSLAVC